jgi:hypothetical protein
MNRDSSVGIATEYGLGDSCSIPGRGQEILLYSTASRLGPTQPPILLLPALFPMGVKRPGREADKSSPYSTSDKNGGAIPPFPMRLHGVELN